MSECKVISVSSRKGGVGKSTISRNLGYFLAEQGYKILICDIDSQGNLSTGFGEPKTAKPVSNIGCRYTSALAFELPPSLFA